MNWNPDPRLTQALGGRVLVITGAGVSEESGIPTYRGGGGLWESHSATELASAAAFARDPLLVWRWYVWRRQQILQSAPNPGHRALVPLEHMSSDFLLVTQNVDDLHERAGSAIETLVHVHGEIFINRCTACTYHDREPVDVPPLPLCPVCGSLLRPGVIWFDEDIDTRDTSRVEGFIGPRSCDAVLVVGTNADFDYIVAWARRGAARQGLLVEINPSPTLLTPFVDIAVRERAGKALPAITQRLAFRNTAR